MYVWLVHGHHRVDGSHEGRLALKHLCREHCKVSAGGESHDAYLRGVNAEGVGV